MYENDKIRINWMKIGIRVVIAFLVLILTIKLVAICLENRNYNETKSNFDDNLKVIDAFAKEYFKGELLPSKAGGFNKISLQELVDNKKIDPVYDEHNEMCNLEESFIKVTKLDGEYQIQSYLVCGEQENYLNSFIEAEKITISIKPTTTTTTTKRKTTVTTKKTTVKTITSVTKKNNDYRVSFNSNGGSLISSQVIKKSNRAVVPKTPIRKGYTFVGWYYEGKLFDFNTKITHDYVLIAKWTK